MSDIFENTGRDLAKEKLEYQIGLQQKVESLTLALAKLKEDNRTLREALELLWPLYREDECANSCFERIGAWFQKETGFLRPGKDSMLDDREQRSKAWSDWITEKRMVASVKMQKALSTTASESEGGL